jgi:C_GCAxxG_C_C family probable redox protein
MNAKELFESGYNCSQSVFVPFAHNFFPDDKLAFKIMSPFGGGLAHTDNLCGAVSGAIAAIGLHFGHTEAQDSENKVLCAEATRKFISEFRKKHGSIKCTKLIGYNLKNPQEKEKANEVGVFKEKCTVYVESATVIVSKVLAQFEK